MSILLVIVFNVVFVSFPASQAVNDLELGICAYEGKVFDENFEFKIDDIPECCKIVYLGVYLLQGNNNKTDEESIKALVNKGIIVYTGVGLVEKSPTWDEIFEDPSKLIDPLKTYVQATGVKGVVLDQLYIHNSIDLKWDKKIKQFVDDLKKNISTVKVGIFIEGYQYKQFTDGDIDYTILNESVDLYMIDSMNTGYICGPSTATEGTYPINVSDGDNTVSIHQMCQAVKDSKMQQTKTVMVIDASVRTAYMRGEKITIEKTSYSSYCFFNRKNLNVTWCAATMDQLYERVQHIKQYFQGIMIMYLNNDDYTGKCECNKYPVTNAFLDSWRSVPLKPCTKISGP